MFWTVVSFRKVIKIAVYDKYMQSNVTTMEYFMARPKPEILAEYVDPKTYKAEQVLKADAIYAVFYKGEPINIRTLNKLVSYPGPKYKKSSFSAPGHALNLAARLNEQFKTEDFTVRRLIGGDEYTGDENDT